MKIHYQLNGKHGKPIKAGLALLEYMDVASPSREGDVITIPKYFDMFQLLSDFSQFLLLDIGQAWFGGTDERPFLVELVCDSRQNWVEIWKEGKFFETIKPDIIKRYENLYGKEKTLRQGDIWAFPLSLQNWGEIGLILTCSYPSNYDVSDREVSLFGTRHILHGKWLSTLPWGYSNNYVFAQGTITAPDHTTLILDNICVLAQTAHLKDGRGAD